MLDRTPRSLSTSCHSVGHHGTLFRRPHSQRVWWPSLKQAHTLKKLNFIENDKILTFFRANNYFQLHIFCRYTSIEKGLSIRNLLLSLLSADIFLFKQKSVCYICYEGNLFLSGIFYLKNFVFTMRILCSFMIVKNRLSTSLPEIWFEWQCFGRQLEFYKG